MSHFTSFSATSRNIHGYSGYQPTWNGFNPFPAQVQNGQSATTPHPKPERNIRDVNEAKAARRSDIERRCGTLDPPIPPNVLNHMDSFQAALQISQPMTDTAWQVLKPRLLSQLAFAERREKERAQEAGLAEEECKQRRQQEMQLKETKDGLDRQWEAFQGPVRNRIGALADDIISTRWAKGSSITKENTPKFAADVLVQVRQQFYAGIAKENEATVAAGGTVQMDTPNGPPVRTLILENMKWVFDSKVKPLTDHFQRELFLCNGCDGHFKFYGFEGVIQHFAAKHTTTLSMGNIVVHWRAEWPEHPPFHPNPSPAKTAYYKVPTPAPTPAHSLSPVESNGNHPPGVDSAIQPSMTLDSTSHAIKEQGLALFGGPQETSELPKMLPATSYPSVTAERRHHSTSFPPDIPGIHINNPGYPGQYSTPQQWQPSPAYGSSPLGPYTYTSGAPTQFPPGTRVFAQIPNLGTAMGRPPAPYPAPYPNGVLAAQTGRNIPVQQSDLYKRQVEEMARHAKEVFSGVGGVMDVPGSVRIFVTIQHMISRFKATFVNDPSLPMFIDGLDHNATMRPVRSINGLACKTCVVSGTATGDGPQHHGVVVGDRRLYTLPHLVNHFRTAHAGSPQAPGSSQSGTQASYDWKHDMIELPDLSVVSSLATAPGMTDAKLGLIAAALPEAFSYPRSHLNGAVNSSPRPTYRPDLESSRSQAPPSEPPGEDEYDPHRPAVLQKMVKIERASNVPEYPARPSILQYGQPASIHVGPEESQHAVPGVLQNDFSAHRNTSRQGLNNGYYTPHQSLQPADVAASPQATDYVTDRFESERSTGQPNRRRQKLLNGTEYFHDPAQKYGYRSDHKREREGQPSSSYGQQAVGPTDGDDVAERFLSGLETGPRQIPNHKLVVVDQETSGGHGQRWSQERPIKRQTQYLVEDGARDDWRQETDQMRREVDPPNSQLRQRTLIPRENREAYVQPRPASRPHYHDESHPSSRMQMPLKTADGYSPTAYVALDDRESPTRARAQQVDTQHYQVARTSQCRGRSRSPPRQAPENVLYRTRSPVEEDRGESVYQVRAVPPRRSQGTERVVSYDYPQRDQYEYVGGRNGEPPFQTRVEYVPVRMGDTPPLRELPREPARYVISQPPDQTVDSEYGRYEPSYAAEPVYEINGQLVPAIQRRYVEPLPSRTPAAYSQEYRY